MRRVKHRKTQSNCLFPWNPVKWERAGTQSEIPLLLTLERFSYIKEPPPPPFIEGGKWKDLFAIENYWLAWKEMLRTFLFWKKWKELRDNLASCVSTFDNRSIGWMLLHATATNIYRLGCWHCKKKTFQIKTRKWRMHKGGGGCVKEFFFVALGSGPWWRASQSPFIHFNVNARDSTGRGGNVSV